MMQVEKKKRTHSGSRSSRKVRGNELSVELRGKASVGGGPGEGKLKTENSSSLNRSRPSRKNSTKQKKHMYAWPYCQQVQQQGPSSRPLDIQEPASHSVSADRRHSIARANRTEANFEGEEIEIAIDQLLMGLRSLPQPPCLNARLLNQYFSDLKRYFGGVDGPFGRLCLELHQCYVGPMQRFLQLVAPMEEAIRRREEIAKEIDRQIVQNEELYDKLEPIDVEIFKLKEKIEQNRMLIEQKKKLKQSSFSREKDREKDSLGQGEEREREREREKDKEPKGEGVGRGFKLDLEGISKLGHKGYHQEFYSKMDEFSQSWRDQALKEKRF